MQGHWLSKGHREGERRVMLRMDKWITRVKVRVIRYFELAMCLLVVGTEILRGRCGQWSISSRVLNESGPSVHGTIYGYC